jgi:thiamine-monophosphate kinase
MPMGEFDLIAGLAPYLDGAGDDTAVVDISGTPVCLTIDVVVDGVHVDRAVSSLDDVGWKALAVNVSDLAAMGASPEAAVVGLSRPAWLDAEGVHALYRGMQAACARWEMRLVGGDTVAAQELSLAVAALGLPPASGAVPRGGARAGDRLVVVGALGAAAAALVQRAAGVAPSEELLAAHRRPVALPAAGQALAAAGATAMIDVSDGLGADLGHICAASGVRVRVGAAALPVAHGEGRFVADDSGLVRRLASNGQVAVRYAADDNPNGSVDDIAGICDASGLFFGLMPHPERYTRWTQHPFWTRLGESETSGEPLGLAMFRKAVAHAERHAGRRLAPTASR